MPVSTETERLAHEVIGAAIEVHRQLGPGYFESAYQTAMEVELRLRGIAFESQHRVEVSYKGTAVAEGFTDLYVGGELVVELKAVELIAPVHVAQVISYLRAKRKALGLLINFNVPLLRDGVRRVILSS